MCPDPRPLRAATTTERTTAAIGAIRSVPPRRSRLPAERRRATEDHGVLWRDRGRSGHVELRLDRSNIVIPCRPGHAFEAVLRRPFIAHGLRRRDARHPVDQGPASDCGARQHRDRAVPRRQQSTIEVEPVEGIDLGARHRRLVDERSGLDTTTDLPAAASSAATTPAAGSRTDDDDVGLQHPPLSSAGSADRRGRLSGRIALGSGVTGGSSGRYPIDARRSVDARPHRRTRGTSAASEAPGRPSCAAPAATSPSRACIARGPRAASTAPRRAPPPRRTFPAAKSISRSTIRSWRIWLGSATSASASAASRARSSPSPATNVSAMAASTATSRSENPGTLDPGGVRRPSVRRGAAGRPPRRRRAGSRPPTPTRPRTPRPADSR